MKSEENEKCGNCCEKALKETDYCIRYCKNYDKFRAKDEGLK